LLKSISEDDEQLGTMILKKQLIKTFVCGGRHNLLLTYDGALFSFGFGQ
jgi:alpha-tubulin suppressor-like RCC1 family protein